MVSELQSHPAAFWMEPKRSSVCSLFMPQVGIEAVAMANLYERVIHNSCKIGGAMSTRPDLCHKGYRNLSIFYLKHLFNFPNAIELGWMRAGEDRKLGIYSR